MGHTFTWREEDRVRLGNCGRYLTDIIEFSLEERVLVPPSPSETPHHPSLSGTSDPSQKSIVPSRARRAARTARYRLYDPSIQRHGEVKFPQGETGYAFEYQEIDMVLTQEEAASRIESHVRRFAPEYLEGEKLEAHVKAHVGYYLERKSGLFSSEEDHTVPMNAFVRWVSKEEYLAKLALAREQHTKGTDNLVLDRWNFGINSDQQQAECRSCPLNTARPFAPSPIVEALSSTYAGLEKGKARKFLEGIVTQMLPSADGARADGEVKDLVDRMDPQVERVVHWLFERMVKHPDFEGSIHRMMEVYGSPGGEFFGCHESESYGGIAEFLRAVERVGDFPVIHAPFEGGTKDDPDTNVFEDIGGLEAELLQVRKAMESSVTPVVDVFTPDGMLIGRIRDQHDPRMMRYHEGYAFAAHPKKQGITLRVNGKRLYEMNGFGSTLPRPERFNPIVVLSAREVPAHARRHLEEVVFSRILRKRDVVVGETLGKSEIELPPIPGLRIEEGTVFGGMDPSACRMEYGTISTAERFSYELDLFDRLAAVARKADIPIMRR